MTIIALGSLSGGCSMSYQLGSMFEKSKDDKADKFEATGSVAPPVVMASFGSPSESDLAYARAAAADVLARDAKDASQPWENPKTGARGTVTPLASAYTDGAMTCRDFLASYVSEGAQTWLQGEACRFAAGKWEVRSMKPWKRS